MKRYVLLGTVGAGKSTLYAALHGIACDEAKKTQAMQYDLDGGVDTPGEFFCHPMYYPALLSTTVDTDVLIYVHPANDPLCRLIPLTTCPLVFSISTPFPRSFAPSRKCICPTPILKPPRPCSWTTAFRGLSSLSEKIALNSCRNWWIGSRRNKFQLVVSRE